MKADITSRADIENFVVAFYDKVKQDATIGFIFNDVVQKNWEHHIAVIVDFWETILLDNPVYKTNAMEVHYILNKKQPLSKIHFDAWLYLFTSTIDEMYEGSIVLLAKKRAKGIADMMLYKMDAENKRNSL